MKKKLCLLFGGKSAEHEVSVQSAKNVAAALDTKLFDLILVGISQQGSWYKFPDASVFQNLKALNDHSLPAHADPVSLISKAGSPLLFSLEKHTETAVDVAFPVMHGTYGEDGCIQGLFRMMNLPFVGCSVAASSTGMDKDFMKRLFREAGIPTAKFQVLHKDRPISFQDLEKSLGLPFFIKPANMGSSVGVHKIKSSEDFKLKSADAFKYDTKLIAEEFIDGREIECSVFGPTLKAKASLTGEVTPTHEFYSYEAKYLDEKGAVLKIPSGISAELTEKVQKLAVQTYETIGCDGLTRVDFFLKSNGQILVNEVNTIPGFTKISMYPKMWEASGLGYSDLITGLLNRALERHQEESALQTQFC